MTHLLPDHTIVPRPASWLPDEFFSWAWSEISPLTPLQGADGQSVPQWSTAVRLCADPATLYVHFDCHDPYIWGTFTERDDPVYDEEVVEVFIAPGAETPTTYYEFEVTPNGVLLDLCVHSPHGDRTGIETIIAWDCPGIQWHAYRDDANDYWRAALAIPWRSLHSLTPAQAATPLPTTWRANFYRIERPPNIKPEFSCWSPTLTEPADFHRAGRFGTLYFPVSDRAK